MDDMMKINLLIGSHRYPLTIRRKDEQLYRDAAKLIDKTLTKYRTRVPDKKTEEYWEMASLDMAFALISMKDRNDTEPYLRKLEELTKELDKYIQ